MGCHDLNLFCRTLVKPCLVQDLTGQRAWPALSVHSKELRTETEQLSFPPSA